MDKKDWISYNVSNTVIKRNGSFLNVIFNPFVNLFTEVYLQTHVKILHIKKHTNIGNDFLTQHRLGGPAGTKMERVLSLKRQVSLIFAFPD